MLTHTHCMCACVLNRFSHDQLCGTLWTVARQGPLSLGFSREEYWSGLLCLPLGGFPNPGIKSVSLVAPALQMDSLPLRHWGRPIYTLLYIKLVSTKDPLYSTGNSQYSVLASMGKESKKE